MKIRFALVRWLLIPAEPVNLLALVVWCSYILLKREPLSAYDPWPWIFIGAHGYVLAGCLGRTDGGSFAFLYGRGFSRDVLWAHQTLVTVMAVLMALLPPTLIVCLSIRSHNLDVIFRSPYYPILAPFDREAVLAWWIGYAVSLPMFHYAWIRRLQPTAHNRAGDWLSLAFLAAACTTLTLISYRYFLWEKVAVGVGLLISVVLLFAGWRLHRSMEVPR